jgi:hypothetical protein
MFIGRLPTGCRSSGWLIRLPVTSRPLSSGSCATGLDRQLASNNPQLKDKQIQPTFICASSRGIRFLPDNDRQCMHLQAALPIPPM